MDHHTPHMRDELYVVAAGQGWFVIACRRRAARPRRLEQFSEDFGTLVMFDGLEGGE